MREKPTRYYPGIEFSRTDDMGLTATTNDENGNGGTYGYLTDDEAKEHFEAWLNGEQWVRSQ